MAQKASTRRARVLQEQREANKAYTKKMAARGQRSGTLSVPSDNVNHPAHYNAGRFETIDVIEDIVQHYTSVEAVLVAQVLRYLSRAPLKDDKTTDLCKAQWYLNRLVEKQQYIEVGRRM